MSLHPESSADTPVAVLRAAGTCVVLDVTGPGLPVVLHWGADLGDSGVALAGLPQAGQQPVPHSGLDDPWPLRLVPTEADGWSGTPGVEVHRGGCGAPLRLRCTEAATVTRHPGGGGRVEVAAVDDALAVRLDLRWDLDPHGVLSVEQSVTSTAGSDDPVLNVVALRGCLPLPPVATELLDLTGRWTRERSPQRAPLLHGSHRRAGRRGRTGHDAPLLLCAGTEGFGFRQGEVWAAHVAWSGDSELLVERLPEGAGRHASVLAGGELLRPGEVRLGPGRTYRAPAVLLAWSDQGLDGVSRRFHHRLRARPCHPTSPRPLVLNTWEAVYFDHDLDRLRALADTAARIGVERFVLDDGWFTGRRDDRRGLGDWQVDRTVWPAGLHPLVDHVRSLGMQVGLWVEPEMVNVDSDLVRAHPTWVLGPRGQHPRPWRHQQVLDLTDREAWQHVLDRLDALVGEYALDYLKWDHNRDLHEAVHVGADGPRPAVRSQTLAVYALLDELRRRHPRLEIESCASGGARVDLGILQRTDRVWASDSNDALERQAIQRWTGLLVPPELVGSHVGPATAHTTSRGVDLGMRLVTALFGSAGIEWDVTACSQDEVDALTVWAALYRELRALLHTGDVVRADPLRGRAGQDVPDELVHGVVSADQREAVYAVVRLTTAPEAVPGARRLPGLATDLTYRVRVRTELPAPATTQIRGPGWFEPATGHGLLVHGSVLTRVGLAVPVLAPAQAMVLHLRAERP